MWLGNYINPIDWDWQVTKCGLAPVATQREPAPHSLLVTIVCKCNKGCRAGCSYRKTGTKCLEICDGEDDEQMLIMNEED